MQGVDCSWVKLVVFAYELSGELCCMLLVIHIPAGYIIPAFLGGRVCMRFVLGFILILFLLGCCWSKELVMVFGLCGFTFGVGLP